MRMYHAINQDPNVLRLAEEVPLPNILLSFAYTSPNKPEKTQAFFDGMRERGTESIMLDCGAFTAHMQGGEVSLADYERAIERWQPDVYVQLDVIGDADATRANLERMRKDGFDPVPIFTRGAPWEHLRRLKAETDYIALGNISNGRGTVQAMQPHLDKVFAILGPGVKTHAFGTTSGRVMLGWPFYSADSTAVLKAASYGLARELTPAGEFRNLWVNVKPEHTWRNPDLSDALGEKNWRARRVKSAREVEKLARHVTKVWATRGVVWPDDGMEDCR